ncbi:hypothetical protein QJQ45_014378 [Haematococcus lacustris]|nr:hypothetical protein QJQ45_014378 [Haematococcus lacustris]
MLSAASTAVSAPFQRSAACPCDGVRGSAWRTPQPASVSAHSSNQPAQPPRSRAPPPSKLPAAPRDAQPISLQHSPPPQPSSTLRHSPALLDAAAGVHSSSAAVSAQQLTLLIATCPSLDALQALCDAHGPRINFIHAAALLTRLAKVLPAAQLDTRSAPGGGAGAAGRSSGAGAASSRQQQGPGSSRMRLGSAPHPGPPSTAGGEGEGEGLGAARAALLLLLHRLLPLLPDQAARFEAQHLASAAYALALAASALGPGSSSDRQQGRGLAGQGGGEGQEGGGGAAAVKGVAAGGGAVVAPGEVVLAAGEGDTRAALRAGLQQLLAACPPPRLGEMSPQGLANLLYAVASLDLAPDPDWLAGWLDAAEPLLPAFAPQHLANAVWALAAIAFFPGDEWLDHALGSACRQLAAFSPQGLTTLLASLAHLAALPAAPHTGQLLDALALNAPRCNGQDTASALWALARLQQQGALGGLTETSGQAGAGGGEGSRLKLQPGPGSGQAEEGGPSTDSLPPPVGPPSELELGPCAPPGWWEALEAAWLQQLPRQGPRQLANCCWALARLRRHPGPALQTALLAKVHAVRWQLSPQGLACCCWALARLPLLPPSAPGTRQWLLQLMMPAAQPSSAAARGPDADPGAAADLSRSAGQGSSPQGMGGGQPVSQGGEGGEGGGAWEGHSAQGLAMMLWALGKLCGPARPPAAAAATPPGSRAVELSLVHGTARGQPAAYAWQGRPGGPGVQRASVGESCLLDSLLQGLVVRLGEGGRGGCTGAGGEGEGEGVGVSSGSCREVVLALWALARLSHWWRPQQHLVAALCSQGGEGVGGIAEVREFVFDPDTQIGVGIDPGVTQAVSAASGVWDPATGQLKADQLRRWKLTKGEVKHASGLNNARRITQRWLAPIKPHLCHLAAAKSAGTSLEANLKHITVTMATWEAVWKVCPDPNWAWQWLRVYGAQDRALQQFFNKLEEGMEELSMKRHGHAKQLVVFFGAATIGTAGGRIGESRWRPLELCFWPDQGALPAKGKEYPGLGYKRLRDKPPKAQEQQQQPAEAQ